MAKQYIDPIIGSDAALVARTTTAKSTVTAVTKANPCQVTLNSHGFSTGDIVYLTSIGGMSQINNATFTITYVDANNFTLDGVNSTAYSTYTSGGVATPSATATNPAKICVVAHGYGEGQIVKASAMTGGSWGTLNSGIFKLKNVTTNTFELTDINGNNINATGFSNCTNAGTWTQWRKIAIQNITQANPAVVTAAGHGYSDGNLIVIEGVVGMTEVNDKAYTVANKTTDTFELSSVDSSAYTAYTSGGTSCRPFLTPNNLMTHYSATLEGFFYANDEVRIGKTFIKDASIQVGSGNITFTRNSATVTTSVDLRASLAVNNYIGLTTATIEGWNGSDTRPICYYKISAITASTITLQSRWADTTQTVSLVNRLRLGTEIPLFGSAGGTAVTTTTNGCLWEGGYDFIHNTSVARTTGQTAVQPITTTGDVYLWSLAGTGEILRYMGMFDATRCVATSGTNNIIEYCFVSSRLYYGFQFASATTTARYCAANGLSGYSAYYSLTTIDSCYVFGNSGFNIAGTISNCVAECVPATTIVLPAGQTAINCKADTCSVGFNPATNCMVSGCICKDCTSGIVPPTLVASVYIYDCTITGSTTGISLTQNYGTIIESCSFSGNTIDIFTDQYSSDLTILDCDTTTPTSWFISRTINGPIIDVLDCTIDAPSIAKAINIVATASYNSPQYRLQNSFGLPSGAYYPNGSYVEDSTVYRTSGSSMKLQYTTTVSASKTPIKIASFYVTGGVAKTVSYYLKRDASTWVGTLTPILRLCGTIIKTGTAITSLTTDWVEYTISATAGEITEDGELALEFINNANTVAIWIDDVTVS